MVVMDAGAHSEHVQVIRCNFKPGSIEEIYTSLVIVRLLSMRLIFLSLISLVLIVL
jgi:hypothetical protein